MSRLWSRDSRRLSPSVYYNNYHWYTTPYTPMLISKYYSNSRRARIALGRWLSSTPLHGRRAPTEHSQSSFRPLLPLAQKDWRCHSFAFPRWTIPCKIRASPETRLAIQGIPLLAILRRGFLHHAVSLLPPLLPQLRVDTLNIEALSNSSWLLAASCSPSSQTSSTMLSPVTG